MPSSIINSDDGVISGTSGLKSTGGDDGVLKLQTKGTDAVTVNATQVVSLANALPVGSGGTGANTLTAENVIIGNGTSAVKFVAAGTSGNVLTSNGTAWASQAITTGGDYIMQVFTTPGTWTKPAGLKAVKVTVIGGGGGVHGSPGLGGGGTSSFGGPTAFLTATGGAGGNPSGLTGAGGAGSNGQLNSNGQNAETLTIGCVSYLWGGASAFGFATQVTGTTAGNSYGGGGAASNNAGGGGGGGSIEYLDAPTIPGPQPYTVGAGGASPTGKTGGTGVVIVEEFY